MVVGERERSATLPQDLIPVKIIGPDDPRSPLEILRSGESAKQENATIPLGCVMVDYSLIDDGHAEELKDSMEDKWGQTSSITVRARELNSRVVYDIIDGFHRTEGRKRMGAETIKANVLYGVTDEEMFDLRIVAANSVRSVQFPRIAEWISRSYGQTQWARNGIPVTQAFTLVVTDRETSYKVSQENLDGIKKWVKDKCRRWQRSPGYIYDVLKTVEAADPELVKKVRTASGGRDREQKVTPSRLKQIATGFPGRSNFYIQRFLMEASITHRLYAPQTARLVEIVRQNLKPGTNRGTAQNVISAAVSEIVAEEALAKGGNSSDLENEIVEETIENFGTTVSASDGQPITNDANDSNNGPSDEELRVIESQVSTNGTSGKKSAEQLIEQIAREAADDDDPESRYRTPEELLGSSSIATVHYPSHDVHDTRSDVSGHANASTLEDIKKERDALRAAVELSGGGSASGWWVTAKYLSSKERTVMVALFTEGLDFEQISKNYQLLPREIGQLLTSALTRQIKHRHAGEASKASEKQKQLAQ